VNQMFSQYQLVCISGLTPQVVTETLYAHVREDPDAMPTEIHVLSTTEGIERARLTLLSDEPGWFHRLRRDYAMPPIRFDADCLHTLAGRDGKPLSDIRDASDNIAAADGITEWIRTFTEDENSRLHVSLAGGRKTLGFFAGYALSLYGRAQDRLSHVLVDPAFESHPEFFYPTPYSRVIFAGPPDRKPMDTKDAAVTLADIPFVRLRQGLPDTLLKGRSSFSQTVQAAQRILGPARLQLDLRNGRMTAGGQAVVLPPAELAFYAWLARRAARGLEPVPCPSPSMLKYPNQSHADAYLREYRTIIGQLGDDERVTDGLRYGMDRNYFERRKSRVNTMLRSQLGPGARLYEIRAFARRPSTSYGLALDETTIFFDGFGEDK
jgi:CRISPR-associated protein (TIGR02584 family)